MFACRVNRNVKIDKMGGAANSSPQSKNAEGAHGRVLAVLLAKPAGISQAKRLTSVHVTRPLSTSIVP